MEAAASGWTDSRVKGLVESRPKYTGGACGVRVVRVAAWCVAVTAVRGVRGGVYESMYGVV